MHKIRDTSRASTHSIFSCTIVSFLIALIFFICYYSPHSSDFSLRSYFGASLINSILAGLFTFVICFSISRISKIHDYLANKSALTQSELEDDVKRFDPESVEEKVRNPQPLSNDLYYNYWKQD